MKAFKWIPAAIAAILAAISCGPKNEPSKTLVLYYSQTSNTKAVAEAIADRLGADIEAIVPVNPYDGDFQATIQRGQKELQAGNVTEIEPLKSDLSKYDVIFLGYPVWFGTYVPPIGAVLEKGGFAGKTVVPFCTFGSGGLDSSARDLAAKLPDSKVLPGYGVRAARIDAVPEEIDRFLKAGGFIEGEVEPIGEFSEQHPVDDAEKAIFAAAISTYPMLAGTTASAVASRTIPGGTEYLFDCAGSKIYVIALEGQDPVFTQVVR